MKTWREHAGLPADYELHCPTDVERAMLAEIAELRTAAAGGGGHAMNYKLLNLTLKCPERT